MDELNPKNLESFDKIETVDLQVEMARSYLDYAMSVIVGRALPDIRDGLKPVHRRVLYAMYDAGYRPDKGYYKSSRIVGDVMGNYHPHGDTAIYDSVVRLAQHWSLRYLLIDGNGNFGSPGNDPAAAMRYTEARLSSLAMEMMRDIDEDTVDFVPNYDGRSQEPTVLPSRLPNLLVNGSAGIAVGMATNIPPHNLREIGEAVGLSSSATVHNHLATLQKLGYLRRDPTKPRAIEVRYEASSGVAMEHRPTKHVPLVGDVAAGVNVLAQENVEELVPLPMDFTGDGELFMLRVRGESMIDAGILNGDFVVCNSQATANNGDIVIAGIPGDEATIKTFTRSGNRVTLTPSNKSMKPMIFDNGEVTIYGKLVTVLRRL